MIEIIKEAGVILKDLPDLAVWILIGILLYKVVFIGGVFAILKLLINKAHDYLTAPKSIQHSFGHLLMDSDGSVEGLESLLHEIKTPGLSYVHKSDIDILSAAWKEKTERSKK